VQGYIGADPAALQVLGHQLFSHADWLDALGVRLSANLYDSTWVGPDAEQMWVEWEETRLPALGVVVVVLRDMGARVQEQARQQSEASSVDGATGPGPGGGGERRGGGGPFGDHEDEGWNWPAIISHGAHGISLGVDIAHAAHVPMPGWLAAGAKGVGVFGLAYSGFELGHYIAEGDSGGVILQGGAVVLGIAALVATGPVAIAVLGIAGLGLGIAASFPGARDWVGDRWDEVWAGGSYVIDTVTDGAREILDAGEDLVGDVVDLADNAGDAIGGFASDALGAAGDAFGAIGGLFS